MAENREFIKGNIPYPSQLASFETKRTKEFGFAIASAIESDWFYSVGIGDAPCKFYTNRANFFERRIYAKGQVPMQKYLPSLGTNGDTSLLNLSKKALSISPKLVDVVVNGMVNRNYSVRADAVDPISRDNREGYRQQIVEDMNALPIIKTAKETLGVDIGNIPTDDLPETSDELAIHMQLEYKPSNCLSEQLLITSVMEENMYDKTINNRITTDLVVCGIAWVKNRFTPSKGILVEYVDPADKVHSLTKDPYFRDCFYHGEFKTTLISDVLIEYPHLTEDQKKQLQSSSESWYTYHRLNQNERIKGSTNLLYFTYKTTRERARKIKEKSTGEKVVSDASEFFDENALAEKGQTNDFKRASIVEEILFEGVYVLGTDILLKWEVAENMSRPKSNKRKVIEQYQGCAPNYQDGYIDSLVARMMPIEDKLNINELKAEQIIQGITPDGIAIDLDAIAELDLGDGKVTTAQDQFNMYLQKGSFFYRSYGASGEFNNAQLPFKEVMTGDSLNKLNALQNRSNYYFNLMTDVIGLNKASDASTPDKDSLVGIQKLAALNSNIATRHILDGSTYITLKTAEAISYRVADILKYFPELKEDLIRKIGATSVADLESIQDLHLSDFAIFLDLEPDDEEKAMLNADLTDAMAKGYIGIDDKYKINGIKILDLAIQYLSVLIKKREKKQQEMKAQEFKVQADENIRASQTAEQAKQQTAQMQAQFDAQKQQMVTEGELQKEVVRGEQDRLTEQLKGDLNIQLQYIVNAGTVQKQEDAENRKDDRTRIQATQQSKLVEQRQKEQGPTDFEAENENMDVFQVNR